LPRGHYPYALKRKGKKGEKHMQARATPSKIVMFAYVILPSRMKEKKKKKAEVACHPPLPRF